MCRINSITIILTLSNPTQHGLAIYVKNTADYDLIMFPLGTSIQIMGITLKTSTLGHIPIIVTYKPPQHQPQAYLHNLEKAKQPILKAFQNIIILGDFNMIRENTHFLDSLGDINLKAACNISYSYTWSHFGLYHYLCPSVTSNC